MAEGQGKAYLFIAQTVHTVYTMGAESISARTFRGKLGYFKSTVVFRQKKVMVSK
jgi:hypothetical protein